MREKIVEAVAAAISAEMEKQWGEAASDDPPAFDHEKIATAAIEAYNAAKSKAAEPYVTRVEKGVTYWSNGLCSQSVPGLKEVAEAQMMEYRAYLRRGIP